MAPPAGDPYPCPYPYTYPCPFPYPYPDPYPYPSPRWQVIRSLCEIEFELDAISTDLGEQLALERFGEILPLVRVRVTARARARARARVLGC